MNDKQCKKCSATKPLVEFYKAKGNKDGHAGMCKVCDSEQSRKWNSENKERAAANTRAWRAANPEKYKGYKYPETQKIWARANQHKTRVSKNKWNNANKEKVKQTVKIWQQANSEKVKKIGKDWKVNNAEKVRQQDKAWKAANPDKVRKFKRVSQQRAMSRPEFKVKKNLRSRLNKIVTGERKKGSAVQDLGCDWQQLREHLEAQFEPGMSWESYGRGNDRWNIDHIMPLSAFDLTDRQNFLLANHYLNLRPMWCLENISKKDRIPFHLFAKAA